MVRFLCFALLFLMIFISPCTVSACTSFAVFSGSTIYGMNFDFADAVMKFIITTNGEFKAFHLAFERVFGDALFFVKTAGMNTKGLFSSCQEMHTQDILPTDYQDGSLYTFQLYDKIDNFKSVKEIEEYALKSRLIDFPDLKLHNLFADVNINAIVTEAGAKENEITQIDGKYIVMTNFPNSSLRGKSYLDAKGKGDGRYILCHEFIKDNIDSFTIEKALLLLKKTCNKDPMYPTSCSMVFEPENNLVYLVLLRDFERVYKVSIDSGKIIMMNNDSRNPLEIPTGNKGVNAEKIQEHFK